MNLRFPLFSCHLQYFAAPLALMVSVASGAGLAAETLPSRPFYVPADPKYTLADSVADSLRFTLTKTLQRDSNGHLVSISSFVNPEGAVMGWHDFGNLEGPGWAANAVGGAWEIYTMGGFLRRAKSEVRGPRSEDKIGNFKLEGAQMQSNALAILDHVLDGGFINARSGFIRGYRETTTGKFCLNYKHNSDWFCPGSMAKVAFQLLFFADELGHTARAEKMRAIAVRCAEWIQKNVEPVPNGWFPRRTDSTGKVCRKSPDGGQDSLWQTSADGLFIVELQAALTERGLEGLVILRAIAKHHYGPCGFLTEGVDWNDHVGQQHHIGQAKYAAIQYTEPFLNNQHIVEPTLFYLKNLASKRSRGGATEWFDLEGNLLLRQ